MTPGEIRFATTHFKAPPKWDGKKHGECATLAVRVRGDGTFESAWYPSSEELALLNAGEPVVLTVWGGQPAVSINVNSGEKQ